MLRPLDRYRTPSAMGSAIGRHYLVLARISPHTHTQRVVGVLNRLALNHLGSSTAGLWCYSCMPNIWLDDRGTGQWKWMEEVPRRTSLGPLAFPCLVLCLIGMETEGLLDYEGGREIISIVWWNLRPVIFVVEYHWHRNQSEARHYYFRINYLQNYESESERKF